MDVAKTSTREFKVQNGNVRLTTATNTMNLKLLKTMNKQPPRRLENVFLALVTMPKHKLSCPFYDVSIPSHVLLVSNCSKFENLSDFIILSSIQFIFLIINKKPFYNKLFESILLP